MAKTMPSLFFYEEAFFVQEKTCVGIWIVGMPIAIVEEEEKEEGSRRRSLAENPFRARSESMLEMYLPAPDSWD